MTGSVQIRVHRVNLSHFSTFIINIGPVPIFRVVFRVVPTFSAFEEVYQRHLRPAPPPFSGFQTSPTDKEPFHWKYLGFDFSSLHDVGGRKYVFRFVPDWSICALALVMPAVKPAVHLWLRRRQRKKIARGLCPTPGYDLSRHAGPMPQNAGRKRKHGTGAAHGNQRMKGGRTLTMDGTDGMGGFCLIRVHPRYPWFILFSPRQEGCRDECSTEQ